MPETARLLRRRLDAAKVECARQTEAFELFSEQQQERIPVWKKMVEDFEAQQELGPDTELKEEDKCKNPYSIVVKGEFRSSGG